MIIDFHTHTFPDAISVNVIHKLSLASRTRAFSDGSLDALRRSMETAGIKYSVNLPVMTSPGQVEKINRTMIENREALLSQGIIAFGGMHPDYEDFKSELKRLKAGNIPGIKLHPAYQNVDLDDVRMLRIIEAASDIGLIVLTHAGIDVGIYDRNYSSVKQILNVIKQVRPERFVLAHMGGWGCWNDVERDLAGAPVYMDTAFAVGTITPSPDACQRPILDSNLSNEQFVRIARKHGTDKILFATDSPWEEQKDYIERIEALALSAEEKLRIFGGNAAALLNL